MVEDTETVKYQITDTVLEALILEANLIKKHQPIYNTKEKDNKSYNYVCITRDEFPRLLVERGRLIDFKKLVVKNTKLKSVYGPYPSGESLRSALKIIRKIFPYLDAKTLKKDRYEFYKQIHLAPDVGLNNAKIKYKNTIKNLELFFKGEKGKILKSLEKEMISLAKKNEFERAGEIKKQIFALNHINDVSLIKSDVVASQNYLFEKSSGQFTRHSQKDNSATLKIDGLRIEAYDIAHTSGSSMVGAFVVLEDGQKNPAEYRTFNIRGFTSSNDAGALSEVVKRRLAHNEWQYPDIIVADGNMVQKSVIEKELKNVGLEIPVIAVVKDNRHKAKAMMGDVDIINKYKKQILLANAEVHRFVLNTHRKSRSKKFLQNK